LSNANASLDRLKTYKPLKFIMNPSVTMADHWGVQKDTSMSVTYRLQDRWCIL